VNTDAVGGNVCGRFGLSAVLAGGSSSGRDSAGSLASKQALLFQGVGYYGCLRLEFQFVKATR